jgi:hypothetical protein
MVQLWAYQVTGGGAEEAAAVGGVLLHWGSRSLCMMVVMPTMHVVFTVHRRTREPQAMSLCNREYKQRSDSQGDEEGSCRLHEV